MINTDTLVNLIPWIVNAGYIFAILPQIWLNYRLKTTKGLSSLFLWGYLLGYITTLMYVYCLDFNVAYKIFVPVAFFSVLVMIYQQFLYGDKIQKIKVLKSTISVFCLVLLVLPFLIKNPLAIGNVAGWISAAIWMVYQIPLVYSVYSKKSVEGLSFALVAMIGVGNILEFLVSCILHFPMQTIVSALRGIVIFCIFCWQFWIYQSDT